MKDQTDALRRLSLINEKHKKEKENLKNDKNRLILMVRQANAQQENKRAPTQRSQ